MQISEKNKTLLFKAIDNSIMDLRVKLEKSGGDIDIELFKLSITIWQKIKKDLKIED